MDPLAELQTPDGGVVALGHGALIGRLWTADLHLNDARVSEAHAMVSLRGREVRLLALRGRLLVDGRWTTEVALQPGAVVALARGLELRVVAVHLPQRVFAIEAPGLGRRVLEGVTALRGGPAPRITLAWDDTADAHLWPTGEAWMLQPAGDSACLPRPVQHGDAWELRGTPFRAHVLVEEGVLPTRVDPDHASPVTLTARFDTVHLARPGRPVVVLTGHTARVVSELATAGTALSWEDLARQCWREEDRALLRHRWDMLLYRLRARLEAQGLRTDLVRADGCGLIELVLGTDDVVIDQT